MYFYSALSVLLVRGALDCEDFGAWKSQVGLGPHFVRHEGNYYLNSGWARSADEPPLALRDVVQSWSDWSNINWWCGGPLDEEPDDDSVLPTSLHTAVDYQSDPRVVSNGEQMMRILRSNNTAPWFVRALNVPNAPHTAVWDVLTSNFGFDVVRNRPRLLEPPLIHVYSLANFTAGESAPLGSLTSTYANYWERENAANETMQREATVIDKALPSKTSYKQIPKATYMTAAIALNITHPSRNWPILASLERLTKRPSRLVFYIQVTRDVLDAAGIGSSTKDAADPLTQLKGRILAENIDVLKAEIASRLVDWEIYAHSHPFGKAVAIYTLDFEDGKQGSDVVVFFDGSNWIYPGAFEDFETLLRRREDIDLLTEADAVLIERASDTATALVRELKRPPPRSSAWLHTPAGGARESLLKGFDDEQHVTYTGHVPGWIGGFPNLVTLKHCEDILGVSLYVIKRDRGALETDDASLPAKFHPKTPALLARKEAASVRWLYDACHKRRRAPEEGHQRADPHFSLSDFMICAPNTTGVGGRCRVLRAGRLLALKNTPYVRGLEYSNATESTFLYSALHNLLNPLCLPRSHALSLFAD